jgi:transposase-like protein
VDPTQAFCPNPACAARGQRGQGNIKVHCHQSRRYRCTACGKTFAATTATPFYRLHKEASLLVCVVTLLTHGCPVPAIVAAFGLDERTVADWYAKAGGHAQRVHEHFVQSQPFDLGHVQADELYAKCQGGRCWLAMAMAVPCRLWLGGVVSPVRDLGLIQRLVGMVRRAWLPGTALLICVDGLASYPTAFWRAFREKVLTGRRGRPAFRRPRRVWLARVIKKYSGRRLVAVTRRVLWGRRSSVERQLQRTATGTQINTAYIERLNATFRGGMAALTRRGRRLLRREEVLERGMYLTGGVYNFCSAHRSLRQRPKAGQPWQERTPAMAAGWTDHVWSVRDFLEFQPAPALHG